ncbi:MAG: hypothetical protein EOM26_03050 [Alphaproteobacteria bacterium]|nr:hypothetical protein [Alphaproteobacteria bacterium]
MPERQHLIAAYFRRTRARNRADGFSKEFYPRRDNGSPPHSLIISCFESCPTAHCLFGQTAGDVLHLSEIAALVPPYDSHRSFEPYSLLAKLEYAVEVARVRHIVVLGNSASRGLECLLDGTNHAALAGWVEVARLSMERARARFGDDCKEDLRRETLRQTILQSVRNLLTYPCIYKCVKRGQITLNAWYYENGERCLYAYNADEETFRPLRPVDKEVFDGLRPAQTSQSA